MSQGDYRQSILYSHCISEADAPGAGWGNLTLLPPFLFLSADLSFCCPRELSQLSKGPGQGQMQSKERSRIRYSWPWAAEGSKQLDQLSCPKVCPPRLLNSVQAQSLNRKEAEALTSASTQMSHHPALNDASHVMQNAPVCWHVACSAQLCTSYIPQYLKEVIVEV